MDKINRFLKIRKSNFNYLKKRFNHLKNLYVLDYEDKKFKNSYYCLNIILSKKLSKKRMDIIRHLNKKNIGTSIYYPQPVPRMSYYKNKYGYNKIEFLNAANISDCCISLPVGPHLSIRDMKYIADNFIYFLERINEIKN